MVPSNAAIYPYKGKKFRSGLEIDLFVFARYDMGSLSLVLESGGYFTTKSSLIHQHRTPADTTQEFIFVVFERTSKQSL